MKTLDMIRRYFSENFWIIPIQKDSKIPLRARWTDEQLGFEQTLHMIKNGYNIGVVGGKQSRSATGEDLIMLDFDGRLGNSERLSDDIQLYRNLNTWVQFTPKGFHVLLRHKDGEFNVKDLVERYLESHGLYSPHRTTLNPKHEDNTFNTTQEEHDRYFLDTIRWSSMYILISPSKVNGKSYWWLDDMKGEILSI